MKYSVIVFALLAVACSGNASLNPNSPSTITPSTGSGIFAPRADRRLVDIVSPNSCPMDAPSILVSASDEYKHIDIEWGQNAKAHQVNIVIKRYGVDNQFNLYKIVRETTTKGRIEVPVVDGTYSVTVAYELTLCSLSNTTTRVVSVNSPRLPEPVIVDDKECFYDY